MSGSQDGQSGVRDMSDVRGVQSATAAAIAPRLVSVWVIWGSTYLGLAVLVQTLPPLLTNGIRFLIAAAILGLGLIVFRGVRTLVVTARQLRSAAMMGIALLGVGIGTVSMAERFVPSGITALLVSVMPLWIIIFRLRAGDRPSRWTLAGVAVGMTGLAAMLLPGGTAPVDGGDGEVRIVGTRDLRPFHPISLPVVARPIDLLALRVCRDDEFTVRIRSAVVTPRTTWRGQSSDIPGDGHHERNSGDRAFGRGRPDCVQREPA